MILTIKSPNHIQLQYAAKGYDLNPIEIDLTRSGLAFLHTRYFYLIIKNYNYYYY